MRKDGRMFLAGKSATEGRTSDDTLPNPDNAKLRSSERIKICIGEHCDEDRLLYYRTIIASGQSIRHIERVARPAVRRASLHPETAIGCGAAGQG